MKGIFLKTGSGNVNMMYVDSSVVLIYFGVEKQHQDHKKQLT